ncbi:MAG: imidazole glycerol phosphate synthase subunit HisF [Dehalococcoidia bacterium]|nr:imidazole glycerol phosphate synthase subunit HisF [Dehalococcoidia bacterium]
MRPRVIVCLLLQGRRLVKTTRFGQPRYVGDPINAVRIFNQREADELMLLSIHCGGNPELPLDLVSAMSDESFMPLSVGGGIRTVEHARALLQAGAEKVCVNTAAIEDPGLVRALANEFGSQSVVVSIDARTSTDGQHMTFTHGGSRQTGMTAMEVAARMEAQGAGELFVSSIDRDGMRSGLDIELIQGVVHSVSIPVVAAGGAGTIEHLASAIHEGGASAVAAGSMFVFHGRRQAVLVSYPSRADLRCLAL